MKKNFKVLLLAVFVAVASCSFTAKEFNDPDKDKLLVDLITFVLQKGHYSPKAMDDEFSKNIFNGEPDSETAIKNLELWYKEIKTPTTFKQAGIENPDINAMAKQAYDLLELKDIDDYTEQDIKKIYQASL